MNKSSPLRIHNVVVFALFVRELKTRFGKYRLGYFWAIFDPMSHVLVISFLFMWGFRSSSIAGISAPLLVLTGIVPFDLFRAIVVSNLKAVDANRGLFNYRRIKPSDTITARILLETIIALVAFLVLLVFFKQLGYPVEIRNPLGLIFTFSLLIVFSAGLGLITCVVGPLYPELTKLIPVGIRPLYWVSGVFYAADSIPEEFRRYLLINPLLHVSDLIRASMFSSFTSNSASFTYLTSSAVISLFIGLAYYRVNRIEIVTSKNI